MIGVCICTLIRVHLISAALYELEIERCVVLTRAIAERREVVDVKRGSLQTPSAPCGILADCPVPSVNVPQQLLVLWGCLG